MLVLVTLAISCSSLINDISIAVSLGVITTEVFFIEPFFKSSFVITTPSLFKLVVNGKTYTLDKKYKELGIV